MTRCTVLFLIFSLLAPLTAAAPQSQGESSFAGLFDPLYSLLDWAFSWLTPTTEKSSPFIVPSGGSESPPPTEDTGGHIVPNGVTQDPPVMENSSPFIVPSG